MGLVEPITLFLAEVFGTAILVFLGCMGCVMDYLPAHVAHLQICLNFGKILTRFAKQCHLQTNVYEDESLL